MGDFAGWPVRGISPSGIPCFNPLFTRLDVGMGYSGSMSDHFRTFLDWRGRLRGTTTGRAHGRCVPRSRYNRCAIL